MVLKVCLYKKYFSINDSDISYQYDGPLKSLIQGINTLQIPTDSVNIFHHSHFKNGKLLVQVTDKRIPFSSPPKILQLSLCNCFDVDVEKFFILILALD